MAYCTGEMCLLCTYMCNENLCSFSNIHWTHQHCRNVIVVVPLNHFAVHYLTSLVCNKYTVSNKIIMSGRSVSDKQIGWYWNCFADCRKRIGGFMSFGGLSTFMVDCWVADKAEWACTCHVPIFLDQYILLTACSYCTSAAFNRPCVSNIIVAWFCFCLLPLVSCYLRDNDMKFMQCSTFNKPVVPVCYCC